MRPDPRLIAPFGAETVFHIVDAVDRGLAALRAAWLRARARAAVAHLPEHLRRDVGIEI
ncbi:MAG: hypothetical protein ACK4WC_15805 [Rubrimonas sp.]